MKKIIFVALFAMVGCGSSDSSDEPAGYASEYPAEEQNAFLTGCITETMKQSNVFTKPRATMYCSCMLEKLMATYPYEDVTTHPATTMDALAQTHAKGCVDMAMKY